MATKEAKGKKGKDGEKRSAKKSEGSIIDDEKKDGSIIGGTESTPTEDNVQESPRKEPSPEPEYDEPTLTELIIESFEGEKLRGLYEGESVAHFTGGHLYKGMFMEGHMHGKGCYTWSDGVTYEGEFYQNKVTGKGSYRWPDGSTYEGDVVNGKRHGDGAFHYKGNKVSYSGEWCEGKRNGKGKMEYDSEGKSFYDGDWVNNVKHGWGTRQYPSGNVYQGMWFNNVRHGEGTMKWLDKNQIYNGNWENGIQHGMGQHNWLLRRKTGSQYPLRNMYDGEFVNGLRHGFGTFLYANGAKYEGGWKNNMKHGKGKFTFKNGRIYEGMFERDHIVEYPDFTMDGATTPDITQIRTRTPLPGDNLSVHSNESRNTISPSFQLDIEHLLNEFTEYDREEEARQALCVVMRNISVLRKIYNFYSCLGYEESTDNTFVMNKMQFWRFMKDCKLHDGQLTLMDMDRMLGHSKASYEIHNPYERILIRQFVNSLIILAYYLYHEEHEGTEPVLASCMSKLIQDKILRNACNVQGHFYHESRRSVNALVHLDQSYEVYQAVCSPRKLVPKDSSMKMRQFLYMMKDLKLINNDLTPKALLDILSSDDPRVSDGEGCCNLELEMTFLEFFEALIGSAEVFVTESVVKDPTTPRPSTVLTPEQSMFSMPVSPSRMASQVGMDAVESNAQGSPRQGTVSPETSSPVRAVSSADGTTKTGDITSKQHESGSMATGASENDHPTAVSRHESVKDIQPLAEQHKSASFVSTHTNATDADGHMLMQSSVSIGGHTFGGQTEGDDDGDYKHVGMADTDAEDDEEELDEATRQFNFWTHQIHIFFVRKFFPAAEKLSQLKTSVEKKRIDEAKERLKAEQDAEALRQINQN
ncbi:radial spoke head 10 homolog B-like [Mizuhopecten yessoensis]|uniref:Radial spoke head 10-like B2 n=1 Tax=Mizuhopecten yessoensis TaxID=6573 RepID=A0A210Q4K1_MIZYE|nr:radial spoke head 10 homolog B-like [Mizuhopecten yessoensis]OWF43641.1 Radial spoke head 10-like B2 [Mizuhopecten yessoensis]